MLTFEERVQYIHGGWHSLSGNHHELIVFRLSRKYRVTSTQLHGTGGVTYELLGSRVAVIPTQSTVSTFRAAALIRLPGYDIISPAALMLFALFLVFSLLCRPGMASCAYFLGLASGLLHLIVNGALAGSYRPFVICPDMEMYEVRFF